MRLLGLGRRKEVCRKNSDRFDGIAVTETNCVHRQAADVVEVCWIWSEQPMYTDIVVGACLP